MHAHPYDQSWMKITAICRALISVINQVVLNWESQKKSVPTQHYVCVFVCVLVMLINGSKWWRSRGTILIKHQTHNSITERDIWHTSQSWLIGSLHCNLMAFQFIYLSRRQFKHWDIFHAWNQPHLALGSWKLPYSESHVCKHSSKVCGLVKSSRIRPEPKVSVFHSRNGQINETWIRR